MLCCAQCFLTMKLEKAQALYKLYPIPKETAWFSGAAPHDSREPEMSLVSQIKISSSPGNIIFPFRSFVFLLP